MRTCARIVFALLLMLSLFEYSASAAEKGRRRKQPEDTLALKCRGIMESFSKVDHDIEKRLDFYSSKGYTHYFYSPSDDKYCNSWGWKFLYNDSDRHMVRSLAEVCRKKGLDFVWTINPGTGYDWSENDYQYLLNKLVMMYYNGIRSFAVNFPSSHPSLAQTYEKLMTDFVATRGKKVRLFMIDMIPVVDYPSDEDPIRTLVDGYYFTDDFKGEAKRADAMICNLSENDDFSRFAVTAVADCAKNPDAYSPSESLASGVESLPVDAREAFDTFLYHMRGAGVGEPGAGARWNDETIYHEFDKLENLSYKLRQCGDMTLLNALDPYLEQFTKFGKYGKSVLECRKHYVENALSDFWLCYISNLWTDEDTAAFERHPVGHPALHAFCSSTMDAMVGRFSGKLGVSLKSAPGAAFDADLTTCEPSDGHFETSIPAHATTCNLLIGRIPEGKRVYFRQLGTDGRLIAEHILTSSYSTFDLKFGAVKVDIIGAEVDIYECIFVYL